MKEQVALLIETIKADYKNWDNSAGVPGREEIRAQMIEEFNNSFEVREGSKYIKIIVKRSVWGFIVNTDTDKKFRKGDILKPAGWAAPARNAARGNILDGGYTVRWTGPLYL